jgi:hypothetical protein
MKDAGGHMRGILFGIPRDVRSKSDQVPDGPRRPDNLHRGACFSPFRPQDRSHLETLSWLTARPASNSSRPAWISRTMSTG